MKNDDVIEFQPPFRFETRIMGEKAICLTGSEGGADAFFSRSKAPMTAVSVWVAMIGLAMHEFPEEREKLTGAGQERLEWFIQEVRRYYPFFPFTDAFMPERFEGWQQTPFNFIPQGGGDYDFGHRCAGEFVTIVMMRATLDFLVNRLEYDVPEQDFNFEFNDIPAVPNDKIKINNYRFK